MSVKKIFFLVVIICFLFSCEDEADKGDLELLHAFVGSTEINLTDPLSIDLPVDRSISLVFSKALDKASAINSTQLRVNGQTVENDISFTSENTTMVIFPTGVLHNNSTYIIELSDGLKGAGGESFMSTQIAFKTIIGNLAIASMTIGGEDVSGTGRLKNIPLDLMMEINFTVPVDEESLKDAIELIGPGSVELMVTMSDNNQNATLTGNAPLTYLSKYQFQLSNELKGLSGESFSGFSKIFYSAIDETPKFPLISDEELLTKVQLQTFDYFWGFAHSASGMARERNTSGDLVTSGGSGFGIMTLIVGMERNFITRSEGLERMHRILDFLETSQRFHGAWPHWINGNTGEVIPFSANDNGGDLVETSFLVQGLITFRQYLDAGVSEEKNLIDRINALCEAVEWDWYRRDGQQVLYWHWSPTADWAMNHQIKGWNECLITYVLAASSPTHGISKSVYDAGWASNGGIQNGNSYEGVTLPLGPEAGGPLFFSHYSFLGLNPKKLSDSYANYLEQNVSHALINYKYCVRNPKDFVSYAEECWGLTASDNQSGYSAHSPTNDLGVITPTAALSSFPYTPDESMRALKFFYYTMGDRLFGEYGFYDAFNITEGWTASSYLAIDQGPIIIMIENYRTGLLWNLFMSAPEVQNGLSTLGFTVTN